MKRVHQSILDRTNRKKRERTEPEQNGKKAARTEENEQKKGSKNRGNCIWTEGSQQLWGTVLLFFIVIQSSNLVHGFKKTQDRGTGR